MTIESVDRDLTGAVRATRAGAIAGFLLAAFYLLVFTLAILLKSDGHLATLADRSNFIDVVIVAALSVGVWKRSRTAAVILLLYFVASQLFIYQQTGEALHLVFSTVFALFFVRGVYGAFAYHGTRRMEDPAYRPARRALYLLWIPGGLIGAAAAALVVIALVTPAKEVVTGAEMRPADMAMLREDGIVEPGEQVVLFYSTALLSIRQQGNLITDRRLISYERSGDRFIQVSHPFDEIAGMKITVQGDALSDSLIQFNMKDGRLLYMFLPPRGDGDKRFMAELRRRMR